MFPVTRKIVAAASIGTVALGLGGTAFAATAAPHLTPANTKITGNLLAGSTFQFAGQLAGFNIIVTCKTVTASGTTPAAGLAVKLAAAPTFASCSDSVGGTDTIKTSGKWGLVANKTGSSITMTVPVKGASFYSSIVPSCVITIAPTSAQKIVGRYDNKSTWKISGSKFAVSAPAACAAASTASATGTEVFTPGVSVAP